MVMDVGCWMLDAGSNLDLRLTANSRGPTARGEFGSRDAGAVGRADDLKCAHFPARRAGGPRAALPQVVVMIGVPIFHRPVDLARIFTYASP
jgi:hypothetical protein